MPPEEIQEPEEHYGDHEPICEPDDADADAERITGYRSHDDSLYDDPDYVP